MKKNYPRSRKDNLVIQEMDDEVMIYDLTDNKAFCLNKTSALIWELCDGKKSLTEISKALGKKLDLPASEGLVWLGLDQLKKENLIENEVERPTEFLGMSRREVIRKASVGSMIILPIVAGLVAPAANAAVSSCGPNGGGAGQNNGDSCICDAPACNGMAPSPTNGPGVVTCVGLAPLSPANPRTICTSGGRPACMCFATTCSSQADNISIGTCQ